MPAVSHYLLYTLKVQAGTTEHLYIGVTGVPVGCSDRRALAGRKQWHLDHPVACLRDVVDSADSVAIKCEKSGMREKADAFATEAAFLTLGFCLCQNRQVFL